MTGRPTNFRLAPSSPAYWRPFKPVGPLAGVVTYAHETAVYLWDGTGGIEMQQSETKRVAPNDLVDAVGFPVIGSYTPILTDVSIRGRGTAKQPIPFSTTADGDRSGRYDGQLITVTALLEGDESQRR